MTRLPLRALFVGVSLVVAMASTAAADIENSSGDNVQEGDNATSGSQTGSSGSGDAVAGQVGGYVIEGSATVEQRNRSHDVDARSGEVFGTNDASNVTGLVSGPSGPVDIGDISGSGGTGSNVQEGDNDLRYTQVSDASSGDAVGGQVVGLVVSGDGVANVEADNVSDDVDLLSGDGTTTSTLASATGHIRTDAGPVDVGDISASGGDDGNLQEGSNDATFDQATSVASGDAVGGQVIGGVVGGSLDVDASNESTDVDADTGTTTGTADAAAVTGLVRLDTPGLTVGDIETSGGSNSNLQEGSNETTATQTISSSSGDAVGGQVIGAVVASGGSGDVTADNTSDDIDATTGTADGAATLASVVGHQRGTTGGGVVVGDIQDSGGISGNLQEGSNSGSIAQTSSAGSGDAVGGQVIGTVVGEGGSGTIRASNDSTDADLSTGAGDAVSTSASFVGLQRSFTELRVGDITRSDGSSANLQEGDNDGSFAQAASAATGDAVGGQVIGLVASGDVEIDATNESDDVEGSTGNADADATSAAFVGLSRMTDAVDIGDISDSDRDNGNVQEGTNSLSVDQAVDAASGDAVGGQVIGAVASAGGSATISADNSSSDVEADTGNAAGDATSAALVGLQRNSGGSVDIGDIVDTNASAGNLQEGDNSASIDQDVAAATGDGVGGQVLGVVVGSGGDVQLSATNESDDVSASTGNADADATSAALVGLVRGPSATVEVGDISGSPANNVLEGHNDLTLAQVSDATSGDAVGGQVAGVVAQGTADITLDSASVDTDSSTGTATFTNDASSVVGLLAHDTTGTITVNDVLALGAFVL